MFRTTDVSANLCARRAAGPLHACTDVPIPISPCPREGPGLHARRRPPSKPDYGFRNGNRSAFLHKTRDYNKNQTGYQFSLLDVGRKAPLFGKGSVVDSIRRILLYFGTGVIVKGEGPVQLNKKVKGLS